MAIQQTVTNFLNRAKGKVQQTANNVGNGFINTLAPVQEYIENPNKARVTLGPTAQYNPADNNYLKAGKIGYNLLKGAGEGLINEPGRIIADASVLGGRALRGGLNPSTFQPSSSSMKLGQSLATYGGGLNPLAGVRPAGAGKLNVPFTNYKLPEFGLSESPLAQTGKLGLQAFEPVFTAGGVKAPLATGGYLGLSGAVGGGVNAYQGGDFVGGALESMTQTAPSAVTTAGFNNVTNPLVKGNLLARTPLNVLQGVGMDQVTGAETTGESLLIDALFPVGSDLASASVQGIKNQLKTAFRGGNIKEVEKVISQAKRSGVPVNQKAETAIKQRLRDEGGKFSKTGVKPPEDIYMSTQIPGKEGFSLRKIKGNLDNLKKDYPSVDLYDKNGRLISEGQRFGAPDELKAPRKVNVSAAAGGFAGIEPYQDEEGDFKVRFNPVKAGIGVGIGAGIKNLDDVAGLKTTRDAKGNVLARSFEPTKINPRAEKTLKTRVKKVPISEVTSAIKKATTQGIDVAVAKPYQGSIAGGIRDRVVKSVEGFFGSQGEAGQRFVTDYKQARQEAGFKAGKATVELEKALKKLTDDELRQFADVAEGKAQATTPNLRSAIKTWDIIRKDIADQASQSGLQIKLKDQQRLVDFAPRDNYYPHFLPEELINDKRAQKKALQQMVKIGWAKSIAEAESKFNQFVRRKVKRRYGNLENAREEDFPLYEKDPRKVLLSYVDSAYHRVTDAKYFGSGDEKAYKLADDIALQGGDGELARRMMDRIFGKEDIDNFTRQVTGKLRGFQTVSKLGLGAITNIGQSTSTMLRTNPKVTVQAIGDALGSNRAEAREFALRAGELLETSRREMLQAAGGEMEFAGKFLNRVGFTKSEQFNRIVATNAGKRHAEDLAKQLIKNPSNGIPRRALQALGLDPEKILRQGRLAEEDALKAAKTVTDDTQFSTETFDLPYSWSSPWGKVLTQFKSFGYKQTQFLGKQTKAIVSEAKQGNLRPLSNALFTIGIVAPVVGEIIQDVKSIVKNRDRSDEEGLERYFNNLSTAMSFGLFDNGGTLLTGKYGAGGTIGAVAGPTVSDAYNLVTASQSLTKDRKTYTGKDEVVARAKPLVRELTKKIPVAGGTLANTFIPNNYVDSYYGANAKANLKGKVGDVEVDSKGNKKTIVYTGYTNSDDKKYNDNNKSEKGLRLFATSTDKAQAETDIKSSETTKKIVLPTDEKALISLYKDTEGNIKEAKEGIATIPYKAYSPKAEGKRETYLQDQKDKLAQNQKLLNTIKAENPWILERLKKKKAPKEVKETKKKTVKPKTKKISLKKSSIKVPKKAKLKTPTSLKSKTFKVDLTKLKADTSRLKLSKPKNR